MDWIREIQDQEYFESLDADMKKEINRIEKEINIAKEKEEADPPKPTLAELRALRLAFINKTM